MPEKNDKNEALMIKNFDEGVNNAKGKDFV